MRHILSCYKVLQPDNMTAGGVGQGGGGYWQDSVGIELQRRIAAILDAELVLCWRPHGRDSYDVSAFDMPASGYDMAYIQLFDPPTERPDCFVWSMISDYIRMETVLENFLCAARPDLIISVQYPLQPPADDLVMPALRPLPNLVNQCAAHKCRVVYLPWFNMIEVAHYRTEKLYAGMCTGKMSGTYPFRDAAWRYLQALNRPDIVLSGNPHGSTFALSDDMYREALASTRYYFSGGIFDLQIPPKYYEVCNYGACLVSPPMPMMEASGFVPWETYVPIHDVKQIPEILDDDDSWRKIGLAGQRMVHERHSIERRAADIVAVYKEMTQ